MAKIVFIEHNGIVWEIDSEPGTTLRDAAIKNGITGILGDCGGYCNCGTCHGYVDERWVGKLPEANENELELLECTAIPAKSNSRLCCQLTLTDELDGIVIKLPEKQV